MDSPSRGMLGWVGIFRLALVQMALGSIVVLTTSTLNRVMALELMLPALVPGLLVGVHHAVQMTRPRMGFGSDVGGRRTPWIAGGMAVLQVAQPRGPPRCWRCHEVGHVRRNCPRAATAAAASGAAPARARAATPAATAEQNF